LIPRSASRYLRNVPGWLFEDSLSGPFRYHALLTDIGLAQQTSLAEDIPETLHRLDDFLPFDSGLLQALATQVSGLGCRLVMCDIAPLGIAVARQAGLPSVLIENFTWDWIYATYAHEDARIERHITYLRGLFRAADYHIQTEPACDRRPADLTTLPVSRRVRTPAPTIRRKLGIPKQAPAVLLTMGGVPWQYTFLEQLERHRAAYFVIPGAGEWARDTGNLVCLPRRAGFYHPDLVNACDAVIGKLGYSTLAEAYWAGVPFGFIERRRFRESPVLAAYVEAQMSGLAISEAQFRSGEWLSRLPDLLAKPRVRRPGANGAGQIARFIQNLLEP